MWQLLFNARAFTLDTLRLAVIGGRWATWITKGVIMVLAFIFALANETKVRIHLITDTEKGGNELVLAWLSLGWLIFFGVVLLVIAVSAGMAWVRYRRIAVGETIEPDSTNYFHRLTIVNAGWADVKVPIYAVAVANIEGLLSDYLQLPFELSWMHQPPDRTPKLARGVPYKVDVFRVMKISEITDTFGRVSAGSSDDPVLVLTGKNNGLLVLADGRTVQRGKLWLALAFGGDGDVRWFSIKPGYHPFQFEVERDDPPPSVRNGGSIPNS
jgi:hypothetical protein